MDDIRNLILDNLQTILNTNTYDVDFVLGKHIMTKDSSLKMETTEGLEIVVKDFIPGMPFVFEGTLIPVDNALIVNYGIVLEFFVMEQFADDVFAALTEIVHEDLQKDNYDLGSGLNINYLASEPRTAGSEIFNYRKAVIIRVPIAGMLSQGVNKGSDAVITIKENGSGTPASVLPFLTASFNLNGELYSAQVRGAEQTTSIITDKSWAASMTLYATDDTNNVALYNMIKNGSAMNKVFDLSVTRGDGSTEVLNVLVASISEVLDTRELQTYTVGFVIADSVLGV